MEGTRRLRPAAAPDAMSPDDADAPGEVRGEVRNDEDFELDPKRAKAARQTRRYARIARTLRVVLIAVALMIVAFIVVWPQIQTRVDRLRIGMASLEKLETDGEGLVNARLTGSDAKGRPYVITADFVRQIEGAPGTLGLERPRGQIEMDDGTTTVVTAADGRFHQDTRLLELDGGVVLVTGDGARYETAAAALDLAAGAASGTDPVQGEGPFGTVTGEGFHATDFGQTIFVDGRSTLVVSDSPQDQPS